MVSRQHQDPNEACTRYLQQGLSPLESKVSKVNDEPSEHPYIQADSAGTTRPMQDVLDIFAKLLDRSSEQSTGCLAADKKFFDHLPPFLKGKSEEHKLRQGKQAAPRLHCAHRHLFLHLK